MEGIAVGEGDGKAVGAALGSPVESVLDWKRAGLLAALSVRCSVWVGAPAAV